MGREKCGWQQKPGRTGLSAFVAKKKEMDSVLAAPLRDEERGGGRGGG